MSSRKSPDVERGGAGGGEKRYVRTDSARSMGSRTASTRSMGSAKNSSSSLVGSPEGSPKAKWNLPDKSLKKIARSGVYTEWCCDREDLWRQCLGISNLKEDIDADRRYFEKTLETPVPKGQQLDEFYLSIPTVPFVDLAKGDYDRALNVVTTKILYAVYQTTGLEHGACMPLLVGLMRQVPLNSLSIFRLIRKLIKICRKNPGLYLDVSLKAAVTSAMQLESILANKMPKIYSIICRDSDSTLKFTMFIVDCFRTFCKPMLHTDNEQLRFLDIFFAEGSKAFCRLFMGVFQLKKNAMQAASCSEAFRLLTTDINVEVALQTGFSIPNVSRSHFAAAEVDPIALKKIMNHLKTIPTFGCANFIPVDYTITRVDRAGRGGSNNKNPVVRESELIPIQYYVQILKWLPKRFQAVQPRLIYTSSVDGFGLERLREVSFGIGPSLLVFKTAGRIESALHTGSSGLGGAPALPAPGGVAEEQDVTFGVFVAGKWTYDMVKKDVEGDGLDGANYFLFRLGPRSPARLVLNDDDETTVMGGKTGARKSNFFRVMTTRSGISFGCRGVSGQETTSAALFVDKNFQHGRTAPYGGFEHAREIVFGEEHPVEFRIQCIEMISLAL